MDRLTGKWYLRKCFFGYKVMVEIEYTTTCPYSLDQSPTLTRYRKASKEDLLELNIKTV